jgi:chromosome segregation ATPase
MDERVVLDRLQREQQALLDQLAHQQGDTSIPDVEAQIKDFQERFKRAQAEKYGLLAQMHQADMELAKTTAGLSDEDRRILTGQATPPNSVGVMPTKTSAAPADQAEYERVLAEIQNVTSQNIELINRNGEVVNKMTSDLLQAKAELMKVPKAGSVGPVGGQQALEAKIKTHKAEAEACREECRRLEERVEEDRARREAPDVQLVQQLNAQIYSQNRMIESLALRLQSDPPPMQPPRTAEILDEVEVLKRKIEQVQDERHQKQVQSERHSRELREETARYEKELERTLAQKASIEKEFEHRKKDLDELKRLQQEQRDLQERRTALQRHIARHKMHIEVSDAKIEDLKEQTSEIRQRALDVAQAAPRTSNNLTALVQSSNGSGQVEQHLAKVVSQLQEKVNAARAFDDKLANDEAEAQADLARVQDEVKRMEEQMASLKAARSATSLA